MANFFDDNDDLQFYFDRGIDWAPLVRVTEFDMRAEDGFRSTEEAVELYREIAQLVGRFAAEEIAPRAEEIDRSHHTLADGEVAAPRVLDDLFEGIKALDLHGMCLPRELGGMNCPMLLYMINGELIGRAETSVMAHYGFHGGIAMAMLMYSILEGTTEFQPDPPKITSTRFAREISEIASGAAWGSMDITEPNAGSDMAALRCRGEQDADGRWFVTGEKIFITSGHGKYHFVIARTDKASGDDPMAGLKGLSLFLVQIYDEQPDGGRTWHATLASLEHKLGHHGSATVAVSFDRTPAQLVGKRGDGFKLMLTLMNNARISVGFEALGLCECAYRMASDYAAERWSMGKTIDQHEMIADYLDEMATDIQALRALAMDGAFHEEMSQKLQLRLLLDSSLSEETRTAMQRDQRRHQRRSRQATPLIKYFGAERAVEMGRRAVQILGGVGYSKEYGAEKLLRDAVVFPIYEGTSQIQALMAMKDQLMAVLKDPQRFVRRMARARALALTARDPLERRVARIQSLCYSAIRSLVLQIAAAKFKQDLRHKPVATWARALKKNWDPKRDFAPAMLHAERLTQMLCDKLACDVLLEQTRAHAERKALLNRYLERAEYRVEHLHRRVTRTGDRILDGLRKADDGERHD